MNQQAQAVVQTQQKAEEPAATKGSILQHAAVIPAITPVHSGILQRCSGGVECEECRQKRLGMIQRAAVNSGPMNENGVPSIVHNTLSSPGQPLDAGTRAFMEPRFGYDFSQVRVHTDARAAESARAVNALAYTVGRDVVFGEGQYEPETSEGKRLLAHELTHVVQQSTSMQRSPITFAPMDVMELEAEEAASTIMGGYPFTSTVHATPQIACQTSDADQKKRDKSAECPKGFQEIQGATWFHCGEKGARRLACAICTSKGRRDSNCSNIVQVLGHSNIIAPQRVGRCGAIFEITVPGRTASPLKVTLAERPDPEGTPLDIHKDVIPQLGLSVETGKYTVCLKHTDSHDDRVIVGGDSKCVPPSGQPAGEAQPKSEVEPPRLEK